MKELSIEQKAKAYDEALEKAKIWQEHLYDVNDKDYADELNYIFPALAKSEDERIRNFISNELACLRATEGKGSDRYEELTNAIAWLEKQGEHAKFRDSIQVGDKVTRNQDGMLVNLSQLNRVAKKDEKQSEQKFEQKFFINDKVVHKATGKIWTIHHYLKDTNSYYVKDNDGLLHHYRESELKLVEQKSAEWSDNDEWCLEQINFLIRNSYSADDKVERLSNWVKSIKDRVQPQPKQEWSEEDESMLTRCIGALGKCYMGQLPTTVVDEIEWLRTKFKSLRPQSTWKPSKEQMKALNTCIMQGEISYLGIQSLYNDLKKLREE